jgi:predicted hydrolase (HD superfamily)
MKSKAFAAQVSREDILTGVQELGVELNDHIEFVLEALRGIAPELGLGGEEGQA